MFTLRGGTTFTSYTTLPWFIFNCFHAFRSNSFKALPNSYQMISALDAKIRDSLAETDVVGKFVRTAAGYRAIISTEHELFKPEFDRYHLYISYACPWANRCISVIKMKGLEECIKFTAVHPTWQRTRPNSPDDIHSGWAFTDSANPTPFKSPSGMGSFVVHGCSPDPNMNAQFIRDLYEASHDTLKKFSVPVLWDKKTSQIVNNESSEIIRMLNHEFNQWAKGPYKELDLYPVALQEQIDELNAWIYPNINDGVYKCGFAKSQAAYNEAVTNLFDSLDRVETILSTSRYLIGSTFTEADLRLFMTLVRFDEVYVVYFKCNKKQLMSYPNIRNYLRDIYQMPGMKETIHMDHIKTHYYTSHPSLNAFAVIPVGPGVVDDLNLPHNREEIGK